MEPPAVSGRPDPADLARYVRQRTEFGAGTWVFENLTGTDALERARVARERAAERSGQAAAPRPEDARRPAGRERAESPPEPGATPPPAVPLPTALPELEEVAASCTRCRLAKTRRQVVFAEGNPKAKVMVVGEAPGANEDRTGLPFVGRAGRFLDLLLEAVDLSREESVYICNVVKCRPPGNRNPKPDEIAACASFLRGQIAAVRPRAILAVGGFAGQSLTGTTALVGKMRGRVSSCGGTPLIVTYHPSALLRNPGWTRAAWEDLQLLRSVLDGM